VKLGIDVLLESRRDLLHGKRVGVITNQTGLTWDLKPMIDMFAEADDINLVALYGPEHGIRGDVRWGEEIDSMSDPRTGLPVHSLYGEFRKPTPEMVMGVDVLVFNIQDVGARFYTYGSTMALCMQTAAEQDVEFIVLDRPNPITGVKIEGNILDPAYSSFVGLYPIPVRHGLTLGEFARIVNTEFGVGCDLTVVPMEGWERSMWFDQTGLSFVMTSWGTADLSKTVVYPGSCFFEGTNVALGLGTLKPCELKGAPWIDGYAWAEALNALDYPGVIFRAAHFTPWYGPYMGQGCWGVQPHVVDREIFRPVSVGLKMIEVVRQMHPEHFEWKRSDHGVTTYWFDQLMGTDLVRKQMEAGIGVEAIVAEWERDLKTYDDMRAPYLLY
jgi:uncharacterized protein YbbC (DUF1343 family)